MERLSQERPGASRLPPWTRRPRAILIAAVSPMRALDDDYRTFFGLVATQIASGLADAQALEEERRRAEALPEIDRAKTAFFSNVSHEFRTPADPDARPTRRRLEKRLRGLAEGCDRDIDGGAPQQPPTPETGQHPARFRTNRGRPNRRQFRTHRPPRMTAELASTFRSAIEKAGLRLVLDCAPFPDDTPVFVDRDMWEKVVLNLLSNAFKFTFEGSITVALRSFGGHIELAVTDTGVGIPASDLPKVFERFHRVRNVRARTHEGTGIGLALVQELVRLHGGEVKVQSEEGRGSTFTVSDQVWEGPFTRGPRQCCSTPGIDKHRSRALRRRSSALVAGNG